MDEEEIKQKRLQALQERLRIQEEAREQAIQREALLSKILTSEAKARLKRIELANPDFANQVEDIIIYLYQTGQLKNMDDTQLKDILEKITSKKRKTRIIRK